MKARSHIRGFAPGPALAARPARRLLALLATGVFSALLLAGAAPILADDRASLLQDGLAHLAQNRLDQAEKSFRRAAKAGTERCGDCQLGLAMVYSRSDRLKQAEKAARSAIEILDGHSQQHLAHTELGKVCLMRAVKKPSFYACAESAFRAALDGSGGSSKNALYYLGVSLVKQGHDGEGVETLRRFVDAHPGDKNAETARQLIEKPVLARKSLLPPFEMKTLDGKTLTAADFAGRVVLLDFWATWCAPCRSAIPTLRRLAKTHEADPFLLVSLSVDEDELMLRDFVHENGMDWTHVWDARSGWGRSTMQVSKYPTYVLLDHQGEIIHRISGGSDRIESELARKIGRAVRAAKKDRR